MRALKGIMQISRGLSKGRVKRWPGRCPRIQGAVTEARVPCPTFRRTSSLLDPSRLYSNINRLNDPQPSSREQHSVLFVSGA